MTKVAPKHFVYFMNSLSVATTHAVTTLTCTINMTTNVFCIIRTGTFDTFLKNFNLVIDLYIVF
jgi:hypothetical protein